jgi:hypothetical protein
MEFEDVFEAIRSFDPGNPLLNLKDKKNTPGRLIRNLEFNLIHMPNGLFSAFPKNMLLEYYRGENDDYDVNFPCVPSVYRRTENIELEEIVSQIKIFDLEAVLSDFPQIQDAKSQKINIDYESIAQHYSMKTDLLDLTTDIAVAAFFATHTYNMTTDSFEIKTEGKGCLRAFFNYDFGNVNGPFRLIGLQPFKRPGYQCAFGIKLKNGEDFANYSEKVLFKQNAFWNEKIHSLFVNGNTNTLFPREEVEDVIKTISQSKKLTKSSVEKYCTKYEKNEEETIKLLEENGYILTESDFFRLSNQSISDLVEKYDGNLFGIAIVKARLAF